MKISASVDTLTASNNSCFNTISARSKFYMLTNVWQWVLSRCPWQNYLNASCLPKGFDTDKSHGQQVLFHSTPSQFGPCVPSLSLWIGELSWTEAWWEWNPNKTSFLGSHFTFQWDQRSFPPSSKSVCTDLSVAAPICVSVCVVTLRDRMCVRACVCVCGSALSQFISLSIPVYRSAHLSPSVTLSILPLHSFPLISEPHPVICLVSIRKRRCDGRQAFLTQQMVFFKAPPGSSH